MTTSGKLEITIKISEFPADVKTVENGWKSFEIDCDGQLVSVTVKPKVFKKLEQAQAEYPMWVAAIAGKMGQTTENGFVLVEPNIQVFEKKPKEPKEAPIVE
ncbi:fertility inhibition FinO-like protein [Trichocoleus sp. Lan]|uniref:fertility inhibition FinO-like protein n=1 Tax=Trichocoleus sp. Lan TaxID=2933927 RepID=UPI0032995D4E